MARGAGPAWDGGFDAAPGSQAVTGGFKTTTARGAATQLINVYKDIPPLRGDEFTPDTQDGLRVEYNLKQWRGQDHALRRRDRQVEENIRILAGQHWTIWNPWLQKFMDVSEWMTDDERRWRQRPVINRILYWFILTHARLTENPPIITFQPSNADRISANLAEVMDTVFKSKWRELTMTETVDRLVSWMIPGGSAFLVSNLDAKNGPIRQFRGDGIVPVMQPGPDGGWQPVLGADNQPQSQGIKGKVGFNAAGQPVSHVTPNGDLIDREPPHSYPEGDVSVDVLSAPQVRGEWGPTPWHKKSWHMVRSWLTPGQIWELFGVEEVGETPSVSVATSDPGFLQRMFFGSGYYGAASDKPGSEWATMPTRETFVEVYTRWEAPCGFPGMQRTDADPGGRLLITTKNKVLRDGTRPIDFRYTSPIRRFDFVNVPGRPSGTTPQEMLNPLQRSYNRFYAQIFENATLHANPIGIIDQMSGLGQVEMTNKPGERFAVMRRQGVPAFEYIQPPSLGRDVYQAQSLLKADFQDLGHIEGAEGRAPTPDPSGKLVKELRFNSDRFLGPTARRMVEELGRMGEDWIEILKVCWDEQKIVAYAGDDTVTRTMTVYPEMFKKGTIHVLPDIESMLPQSRSERQQQILELYQLGAWGAPGAPGAVQKLLELGRFPHIGRTAWPGGVHITTAQQENGKLLRGVPAQNIPIYEWYDGPTHLAIHEEFMASPEFVGLDPKLQQQFAIHRQMHRLAEQAKLISKAMQAQQIQGNIGVGAIKTARAAASAAGVPDPTGGVQGNGMSAQAAGQPTGAGEGEQ